MPTLFAIDTATERMSLALCSADGSVHLHDAPGGALASKDLIPAALALLAAGGVSLRDVDAFAYGRGPGAFTGLRTACSVTQGFALGAGRPVLAVDSLMLVADDARAQTGADKVWVAMDARMDEVYAACYHHDFHDTAAGWRTVTPPALYTLEALNALWRAAPPALVAGSAVAAFGPRLAVGAAATLAQERSRTAALARLALAGWQSGEGLDASQAQPLYLREKVALTSAERLARAAA